LGNQFNGLDISLLVAVVAPAVLYTLYLVVIAEAKTMHGPMGARFKSGVYKLPTPIRQK
jgi:hypothetical protein